mmetsp:Transcript_6155/g.22526  ORF Transcript_6155/g.22526 Transcript_6155/m.22526 type:complete len:352 (+) Transcript_6155:1496-2551(+)
MASRRSSSGPKFSMMCCSSFCRRSSSFLSSSTTVWIALRFVGSASSFRWYMSMWSGIGTSRRARHSRNPVFPQPFCPSKPYRRPIVISMSQSLISSRPFIPMEKFVILISRAVGRDASTPVTVRFSADLSIFPDPACADSAAATSTPFMACSSVVISSSPPFLPLSLLAFFAARFASFSAFFAAFLASFSSFSFATFSTSAADSASSFAFFSASLRPSSFGSNCDSSISSVPRSSDSDAESFFSFSYFSSVSSNSVPSSAAATFAPAPAPRLRGPAAPPSLSPFGAGFCVVVPNVPALITALGLPSSPVFAPPPSSASSSLKSSSELASTGRLLSSSSMEIPTDGTSSNSE